MCHVIGVSRVNDGTPLSIILAVREPLQTNPIEPRPTDVGSGEAHLVC
jgi:hypothetical protein